MAAETKDNGKREQRFGNYEVIAHIATGGMGAVYKARDTVTQRIVALKVMSPKLAAKPLMVTRFRTEAMSAAKLRRHKNIVRIHEFNIDQQSGMYYLALEFIDGKDLHDYIARAPGGRLDPEEARQIILQGARALDHAHRAGIIHRDIKPSNFLVVPRPGKAPLVKLTDLGLSRHEDEEEDHRVTKAGMTLGTVDYIPPEQARDSSQADIRSDLYALGCTLYHMLAGHPPFPKGTMTEKLMQHLEAEPTDIRTINAAVPDRTAQIIQTLLAKNPRDRYQTPAELLEDLENPERALRPREAPDDRELREKKVSKIEERRLDDKRPKKAPERAAGDRTTVAPASERTVAVTAAPKPASDMAGPRKKSKKKKEASWAPLAIGGGVVALLGLIVTIVLTSRRSPPPKPPDDGKLVQTRVEPIVPPAPLKQIHGPLPAELKPLYRPVLPLDPAALVREFHGPFTAPSQPPEGAPVIVVSRLRAPDTPSVFSLAEALAAAPTQGPAIIEIRDHGPHFVASLPSLSQRSLWIRGGNGARPLLAWDGGGGACLLSLAKGSLVLENLDVVMQAPERTTPSCLFEVRGDFEARDCTFSVAGKQPHGVVVARIVGVGPAATAATAALATFQETAGAETKVRFSRCLARGSDLVLLDTQRTPADILIDGTLALGANQTLIQHHNLEEESLTVRIIRSTLAGRQQLWQWQNATGKGGSPRIKGLAWDALLARTDLAAPEGNLLHLADGARTNLVSFRAVNCLYAGWRQLLQAGDKTCITAEDWRTHWGYREGDLAVNDSWPARSLGAPEDVSANTLFAHDAPAGYQPTRGVEPVGCEVHRLPPEPALWQQRTFEAYSANPLLNPNWETPEIPTGPDDQYHGERIELGNFDLGSTLQSKLGTGKAGPRIVLRLAGKGTHATTPLRFRGVAQVVIYFEQPPPGTKEPLTLEFKAGSGGAALIDVEGGSLEVRTARFRFENSRIAPLPPYMIRVRGGDLRLRDSTLIGPLSKTPDGFQSLISVEGSGFGGMPTSDIYLRDSALFCGKPVLELRNPGVRMRCQGCLWYSLGDALSVDLGALATSRPEIMMLLEHNTFVHRQAFLNLRSFEGPMNGQPVVVRAHGNYHLDPFTDEPRQSCLLRTSAESLARGLLLWQGKGNVFARDRLQGYYAGGDEPAAKQPFKDWQKLWGPIGEIEALHVDALAGKKFDADQPTYDRLVLPPTVRVEPQPGADLAKLGLVKKK